MSTIVIVCEGAVDRQNNPIRCDYIKEILGDCGLDARVTTLGHIQRGGSPSAFDRYMATLQGVEAVKAILETDPCGSPSIMIGMRENRIIRLPLMDCVKKTRLVAEKMDLCQFESAYDLRGSDFKANYEIVKAFYELEEEKAQGSNIPKQKLRVAFINCGAPCCGINSANRAIILYCLFKGYVPVGVYGGFSGLIKGDLREIGLSDGPFNAEKGGSFLGMNRSLPNEDMGLVAYYLQKHKIDGLVVIGGFEAYTSVLQLTHSRIEYPALDIPIVALPATISNNVPGTDYSVGCDTALNIIVQSADSLKQSASSSRHRVFVVDVQGGHCGYLAAIGGLASGATYSYIPEEGISLNDLSRDLKHLKERFSEDKRQGRLVLRNDAVSPIFTSELIAKIFEAESEGLFDARWATLGHLQQGGSPSPLDRIRATRLAVLCVSFIESVLTGVPMPFNSSFEESSVKTTAFPSCSANNDSVENPRRTMDDSTAVVIGIRGPSVVFTCAKELQKETDTQHRRPLNQWWIEYRPLSKLLAKYKK